MYSIIDIGSNSVRLMCGGKKSLITSQLSLNMHDDVLDNDSMLRTSEAIAKLCQKAVPPIHVFATEAVRNAKNKQVFIDLVKSKTSLDIDIISGKQEALLSFTGAANGEKDKINVIDLGGASCEIVLGENGNIINSTSLRFGCVFLKNKFGTDYNAISNYVKKMLAGAPNGGKKAIAVGGTATSLAAAALNLTEYDSAKVNGYYLSLSDIEKVCNLIIEGKRYPVIDEKRTAVIVQGGVALAEVIKHLGFDGTFVSDSDNLEGYAIYHNLT